MVETKPVGSVRERLLQAADELFYREGIHTVGIDRVLESAGVAKASLYSAFGSKDELVRAYLQGRSQRLRSRIEARMAGIADPRQRILSIFDGLAERVAEGTYQGCPFVRACAEAPPEPSVARLVSDEHRTWMRQLFTRLCREFGMRNVEDAGRQLALIYDGAAVGASMDQDSAAVRAARKVVERLMESDVASSSKRSKPARGSAQRKGRAK